MNVITAKNLASPPPSGRWVENLRKSMADFAAPGDPLTSVFYDDKWVGRQAVHCVYSVGLKTVRELRRLGQIDKPFCWRFIAGGHQTMTSATGCWATHEASGAPPKVMASLQSREMADILACAEMLNDLHELKDRPNDAYDLRVLRIPGLCLEAFWLKCPNDERNDLLVPYGLVLQSANRIKLPGGATLEKNKAYSPEEFLKIIQESAHKRLMADENPPRARRTSA
jgi:hypothetical protein